MSKRHPWIRLTVALILLCVAVVAEERPDRVGEEAPTGVLVDLSGNYHYLSHLYYQGEEHPRRPKSAVALYFTGLNCLPCRRQLPAFLEIVRSTLAKSEGFDTSFRFYLVSTDPLSARDALVEYLNEQVVDPNTEALLDPYRRTAERFGVSGIPHTIVISPDGRIAADIVGAEDDYRERLQTGIELALTSKAIP